MINHYDAEISNIIENYKNKDNNPTFEIVKNGALTKSRAYKALERIDNVASFKVFWDSGLNPFKNECKIVYKKKD
jgi:hypothetical protein